MIQAAHTSKSSIAVNAPIGTGNVIVAAVPGAWIFIHELIGNLGAAGTVTVKAGSRTLGSFNLGDLQGLTLQDEPGNDGVPRFECRPGEDFILDVTGGAFTGSCDYSLMY